METSTSQEPARLACGCRVRDAGRFAYPFTQCREANRLGEVARETADRPKARPRMIQRAVNAYWRHFEETRPC
jgi:hypothetical protein